VPDDLGRELVTRIGGGMHTPTLLHLALVSQLFP
jgi:hypothetical protein